MSLSAAHHERREREILLELKFDDREGCFDMQVSLADLKQKLLELSAVWLCCTTGFGFEYFCFLGQRSPTLCVLGSLAGKRRAIRLLCKLQEDMPSKVLQEMLRKHRHLSVRVVAEEAECIVDLIAQELSSNYNAVHGTVAAPSPSSKDGAMGCSVALGAAKCVPCSAGVPQDCDTMKEHPKQPPR